MEILTAILVFSFIVLVHELGHFIAARKAGILVEEFSICMGPRILKYKPGETMYSIKLFPLGGSCQMLGEDEEDEPEKKENEEGEESEPTEPTEKIINPRSFNSKPVYWRMIVILGGAFMNIMLALVIAILMSMFNPIPDAVVDSFSEISPIQDAGVQPGDRILRLNGRRITVWGDFNLAMMRADGSPVQVLVNRNGERMEFSVVPAQTPAGWRLGFSPTIYQPGFFESFRVGFNNTVFATRSVLFVLGQLITGQLGTDVLMGPIGLVDVIGEETAAQGAAGGIVAVFWTIMNFVLIISANLAVFNLLPLPALDGGRMIFLTIEFLRGKPISPRKEGMVHLVGFVLLMVLAVFVAYNDILRIFV